MYYLIIAGGRNYKFKASDKDRLKALVKCLRITKLDKVTVRTGGARGADVAGDLWAKDNSLPREVLHADWKNIHHPQACPKSSQWGCYDACAGFRRNERMASGDEHYARATGVVLFPGGSGTADMAARAEAHGLEVFDWRK